MTHAENRRAVSDAGDRDVGLSLLDTGLDLLLALPNRPVGIALNDCGLKKTDPGCFVIGWLWGFSVERNYDDSALIKSNVIVIASGG
ncbi:hypothetical protein FZC33_18705 [Labrys sp. KNU-23]|uniref:hypothetical protein n=1 Tax=Labrys sp. KNU-23 TaxID=2789216 RepID=UPI0011EE7121|nr:hypothetical protein [Labrys sp. KNU-23]QEN88208.1 hypothetical protein FZC33_18705 [Labrys sp. KNU-23]